MKKRIAPPDLPPGAGQNLETNEQKAARMAWWREARFGMFIHWGYYSELGGDWDGKPWDDAPFGKLGEWIQFSARIPVASYKSAAATFNPQALDVDAWVRMAKEAGQKYIIFTTKHCEGLALFRSEASSFNIFDHTPFKRDVVAELAAACARHGIKLGLYYAHAMDWTHPGGANFNGSDWSNADPSVGRWDPDQEGDFDDYLDGVAIPQIRELLTRYGPVAVFWFDAAIGMTPERGARVAPLFDLQPGIITNNRLLDHIGPNATAFPGDTETPEQTIPATGLPGRDFEVCLTMNDTWGFKKNDSAWKPTRELLRTLVDIASKGGNLVLNVGPDGQGRIPEECAARLRGIGRWMSTNGEAVYGTAASPFAKLPWGRCTLKPGANGSTLYLHVFEWPTDARLSIPGLCSPVSGACLLDGGKTLSWKSADDGVTLELPALAPDPDVSVIVLQIEGDLRVGDILPRQAPDGRSVDLPAWMADIHNVSYGAQAHLENVDGTPVIVGWNDPRTAITWRFEIREPGTYELALRLSTDKPGGALRISVGETSSAFAIPAAMASPAGDRSVVARFPLPAAGIHRLELRPEPAGWQPTSLVSACLIPLCEASETRGAQA